MNLMRNILIVSVMLLGLKLSAQEHIVVDKIMAQVGDQVILKSDIETQKLQAIQSGVVISKQSDCEILESLMFQNLLLNQAQIDSIQITDTQVDGEMENRIRVIENQIGGRDKMEAFYGKTINQIKDEFRVSIKNRMLSEEMERQITENITVTPKEVQEFYS